MDAARRLLSGFWFAPLVAGALLWASFPPLDLGWLQAPGWAVLLLSLRLRDGRHAGRQAFVAGAVVLVPGLSWIAPLVGGGWLFTSLWSALFEGLFGVLLARTWLRCGGVRFVVGAGTLHLVADGLRGFMLSGFPWLLPGYAGWSDPVLLGGAGLFGVHGATLTFVFLGAGLAEIGFRRLSMDGLSMDGLSMDGLSMDGGGGGGLGTPALIPGVVMYASLAAWTFFAPAPVERPGPTLALLQGNIEQFNKEQALAAFGDDRDASRRYLVEWRQTYVDLIRDAHAENAAIDAVVWPETMVPAPAPRDLRKATPTWPWLAQVARGSATFAGIMRGDDLGRQWNSVVLVDPLGRPVAAQDKQRLTPGGEAIPWLDRLPGGDALADVFERTAGYRPLSPGDASVLLPLEWSGGTARVGVLICIESIFSEPGREMVGEGADFLLNASNYGWFAGTAEMEQALAMSCVRAAELGIPVVTASNNGISAFIDARGRPGSRVSDATGRTFDVPGFVVGEVRLGGRWTPFRLWGEWPAWIVGSISLILGTVVGRRRAQT